MTEIIYNIVKNILDYERNKDEHGNFYLMHKGIKVVKVYNPAQYKWSRGKVDKGCYVLIPRTNDYQLITDTDTLEWMCKWDGRIPITQHLKNKNKGVVIEKSVFETHKQYRERLKTIKTQIYEH